MMKLIDKAPLIREQFNGNNPFTINAPRFLSEVPIGYIISEIVKRSGVYTQCKKEVHTSRTNSSRENSNTKEQAVTVQAATTVGVMKTQTLCFRPIGKNRASTTVCPFLHAAKLTRTCLQNTYIESIC